MPTMSSGHEWRSLVLDSPRGLWDAVESPPSGDAGRSWTFPSELGGFTYVQSFNEDVPDDLMRFEVFDRIGRDLEESYGQAYEGVLRTADGVRVSPPWLHVEDGVVDTASGRIVMAGRLTHQACGMSPAYETGIGGRNIGKFVDEGQPAGLWFPSFQVYVGSLHSGVVGPVDFERDAHAVDYHHDRELIGVLTHLGGATGAVSVIDRDGAWRTLTTVDGLSGGFTPFGFSADGDWLLVTHQDHTTLVEVASGRHVSVPVGRAYWWPGSPSTLLTMTNDADGSRFELFDLASNTGAGQSAEIAMDLPLDEGFVTGFNPMPSPDGRQVLVSTHAGVRRDYQQKHGCGARIAAVDVATGAGTVLGEIVVNEDLGIERRCSAARWVERARPSGSVQLHPDLVADLRAPTTEHEWLSPDRWAEEAGRMLVLTLNSAINGYQADRHFGTVLPELVGSLACMSADRTLLDRQRDWLSGVHGHVVERMAAGTMSREDARLWAQFADTFERVVSGRAREVAPLVLAWLRTSQVESNPYEQAFPSATAKQLETIQAVWERLWSAHEDREQLATQQVAAISTLVDRLVAENPDLDAFSVKVRDLSNTALGSGLPFELQHQWRWFAENH